MTDAHLLRKTRQQVGVFSISEDQADPNGPC